MGLFASLFGVHKESWHRSKLTTAVILYLKEFLAFDLEKISYSRQMRLWEESFALISNETGQTVLDVDEPTFILSSLHVLSIQCQGEDPILSRNIKSEIPKFIRDYASTVPHALVEAVEGDLSGHLESDQNVPVKAESNDFDPDIESSAKSKFSVLGTACSIIELVIDREGMEAFGDGYMVLTKSFDVYWRASREGINNAAAVVRVKDLTYWTLLEFGWNASDPAANEIAVDMFVKELSTVFSEQSIPYSQLDLTQ